MILDNLFLFYSTSKPTTASTLRSLAALAPLAPLAPLGYSDIHYWSLSRQL
jgi:hypothetical protein